MDKGSKELFALLANPHWMRTKKTAKTRRQNLEAIRSAVSAACGYRRVAPAAGNGKTITGK